MKANEIQIAIHDVIMPPFFPIVEQKTAPFSVDVSLTLCKQAPVSTCKKQFDVTTLTTTDWTNKQNCHNVFM